MTAPEDMSEEDDREQLRGLLARSLADGVITEKTHARCGALLDGEPDPYPGPPSPPPDLTAVCALTDLQTMRIAVRVMELIQELGAPRATPIDVAKIMGITTGIGRAVAPADQRAIFDGAFRGGTSVAQSWAAERRTAASEADS